MFCGQCGCYVDSPVVFCPHCGNKLPEAPSVPVPPPLPWQQSTQAQGLLKRPAIITILAILNIIGGALYILSAIALPLIGSQTKEPIWIWILIAVLLLVLGILEIICGRGLWTLKSYGRTLQLGFACLGLLGFPLWTIISILILVYLHKPEVKLLFSGKTESQLQPGEAEALLRFQAKGMEGAAVAVIAVVALLVIFSIIGIVAAIAIPNLLNAIQRGKQKRTMADMRDIAAACEQYAVDNRMYPTADSMSALARSLEPRYIDRLPQKDAWEHDFRFQTLQDEQSSGPSGYTIVSAGRDGLFEQNSPDEYEQGSIADFDGDLVLSNGVFLQYPEGASQPGYTSEKSQSGMNKQDPRTPLTNSELAVRIMLPPGWKEDLDLNDQAGLQASYRLKELYVIVLTDEKAQYDEMTLEKHSQITRQSVIKSLMNVKVSGPSKLTIQNWPALQYEIHGTFDNIKASYLHTTVETDHNFHQILAWTLSTRWKKNKDTLQEVISSFSEIR